MQTDITALYYTANRINGYFARNVRDHLEGVTEECGMPIISVSQMPIGFGRNICVGNIGVSTYNIYKQILIGAKEATTDYIACCEDDSLYTQEHFRYRPPLDTFAYNLNRWNVDATGVYYHRNRAGMCMCIAPRELLIRTMEERFAKFPRTGMTPEELDGWAEPGRKERRLGLTPVKMEMFCTILPTLTFNHREGMGLRKILDNDIIKEDLPHWGTARSLWEKVHGYGDSGIGRRVQAEVRSVLEQ